MLKQHWLKEFMELKLGNLPAQAFTDKFNKACDKPGKKFNVYMEKNTSRNFLFLSALSVYTTCRFLQIGNYKVLHITFINNALITVSFMLT